MRESIDVAVIGAGAAGLMAAIFAKRAGARVVAYDAAPRIGAKILISGGGRCNVTHDVVRAEDFNGNRRAIAKVLRTFDVPETIDFFASLGVPLKREETGKLFPVSDRAQDVIDALLRAASGVEIVTRSRIRSLDAVSAKAIVIATGGQSVPKTGSDGSGYALAQSVGHSVTPTFPALVPLIVEKGHWIPTLSGTSVEAELRVKSPTGRILHRERGSMLFTHFGLSGPVVLDISRHWIASQPATLSATFLPDETFESLEASLLSGKATLASFFKRVLPDRLVPHLVTETPLTRLSRDERRSAIHNVIDLTLPVIGHRGFNYAEVTAGGVPLTEVNLATMQSRIAPHIYLCGEILDVDGRIGGYNFQWAWASGRLAGISAATLS
jgi:predicted Rossmann fold flavoprotein